jgi:hypothetical protein
MKRRLLHRPAIPCFGLAQTAVLLAFLAQAPLAATILTFDITNPAFSGTENFPEGLGIPAEYGSRVNSTSATSGPWTFGYDVGPEGFTPNVTVSYGPFSLFTGGPQLWRYNYGDLVRVLYQGSSGAVGNDYDYLLITLEADPGFDVLLHGFDLGGWFESDYTLNAVAVYNSYYNGFFPDLNRVFHDQNALVAGAGPSRTTYSFPTPIRANVIAILLAADNLGPDSANIGIDNIQFGQDVVNDVPEPATFALTSAALLALALIVRRR